MPAKKQQQNTAVDETEVIAETAASESKSQASAKSTGAKKSAAKPAAATKSTAAKPAGKSAAAKPAAQKKPTAAKTAAAAKPSAGATKSSSQAKATGAKKASAAKATTATKSASAGKSNAAKPRTTAKSSVNTAAETTATADDSVVELDVQAEQSPTVDNRAEAAEAPAATDSVSGDVPAAEAKNEHAENSASADITDNISESGVSASDNTDAADGSATKRSDDNAILRVEGLKKYFAIQTNFFGKPTRFLKAVDDVSFSVDGGKTIGVVGESGCGKTTLGRTILKLYNSDGGKIYFDGNDITGLNKKQMMKYRTQIQLIFQDPYSSLPPRMTIGQIISEAVAVHKIVPKSELYDYVQGVMKQCGLQPQYYDRYPHEFSGGQRQRICIARALAVKPKLVICDEPVSALDVSIQAQIINLLKDLQRSMGLTYVFISHDLSVVKYITDQILVMYLGNSMELADTDDIFKEPLHPYTQALFSAVPAPDPTVKMNRIILAGDIPSPANPPEGCKFHTRCSKCMDVCRFKQPKTIEARKGHFVTCHLYDDEVMSKLDEYSREYARLEEEKRVKREEERIKKENGKLYRFKKKVVGLFRKPKRTGTDGSSADRNDGTGSAVEQADGTTDVAEKEKES